MIVSKSVVTTRGFRAVAQVDPPPLFREPPEPREPYLKFLDTNGFRCFIHRRAVERMARWARRAEPDETLGLLAGRLCTDNRGTYLVIHDAVHTEQRSAGPGHVHADWQAQEATRRALERECRLLEAVGWWHTHPGGIGLFYSGTDRANQRTWSSPHAVGIVLDPRLHREGMKVYRGPESVEMRVGHPRRHRRLLDAVGRRQSRSPSCPRMAAARSEESACPPVIVAECGCCLRAARWLHLGMTVAWMLILLVTCLALGELMSPTWSSGRPPSLNHYEPLEGTESETVIRVPGLPEEICAPDGSVVQWTGN